MPSAAATAPLPLTPRHQELLRLVAAGHTNAQIARRLGITETTARIHLQNIYSRLPVSSRTTAVTRAFRNQAARYTGRVTHQSDARQRPCRNAQVRARSARHQQTAPPSYSSPVPTTVHGRSRSTATCTDGHQWTCGNAAQRTL
jgi:DNA-binding CsgD family transcriptional regulator